MKSLFSQMLRRMMRKGTLELVHADGKRETFGDGTGDPVVIRFKDKQAERLTGMDAALKLGEMYTDGRLIVQEGTVYDLVSLLKRNGLRRGAGLNDKALAAFRALAGRFTSKTKKDSAKSDIAHHYDLDERLFSLFLDDEMHYSCAYFEPPDATLEEAQRAKARRITAKLLVQPDHHVLDIGSGWGALALYIARATGANVSGVTLSEEQLELSRERAEARDLDGRVKFDLMDYRMVRGAYDRIVSVGMFEHVGKQNYPTFFKTAARLLDRKGVMLLHTIAVTKPYVTNNPWVEKYIFPGGYIPALSEIVPEAEAAGFLIRDVEVWPLHYAQTLRIWRERFMKRRKDAAQVYDERFCRMWEFYLSAAEAAFRHDRMHVVQLQLSLHQDAVPMSRNYIQQREAALIEFENRLPELAPRPAGLGGLYLSRASMS